MYWLRLRQHALVSDLQTSVCWLNPRVVIRSGWGGCPLYSNYDPSTYMGYIFGERVPTRQPLNFLNLRLYRITSLYLLGRSTSSSLRLSDNMCVCIGQAYPMFSEV